jgi:hypothetical protein
MAPPTDGEVTSAEPGSSQGLQLSVYDIDEARADLIGRGVDVSEPFHDRTGVFHHAGARGRLSGPAPLHADYGSFAAFSDPGGQNASPARQTREGPELGSGW